MSATPLPPITLSVSTDRSAEEAFACFTERLSTWWPLATHSVHGEDTRSVTWESRLGGRVFEVDRKGRQAPWGTVLRWAPPTAFAISWHPGRPESEAQRLELRFGTQGGLTTVELDHDGWENYGPGDIEARRGYEQGWPAVLERFVAALR